MKEHQGSPQRFGCIQISTFWKLAPNPRTSMSEKQPSLAGHRAPITSLLPMNMFLQMSSAASELEAEREEGCLRRTTLSHRGAEEHRAFASWTRVLIIMGWF